MQIRNLRNDLTIREVSISHCLYWNFDNGIAIAHQDDISIHFRTITDPLSIYPGDIIIIEIPDGIKSDYPIWNKYSNMLNGAEYEVKDVREQPLASSIKASRIK